ncbi:hypothetical protein [Pseudomonas sp. PLB05]|uniref:hypothetical protein n=1 Tax=Pseudomonas sp. PLB05 TaxID=2899078 RepID=UPI001E5BC18D|nr:hypothetical protein [Pseudomonas sp. PLB05]
MALFYLMTQLADLRQLKPTEQAEGSDECRENAKTQQIASSDGQRAKSHDEPVKDESKREQAHNFM